MAERRDVPAAITSYQVPIETTVATLAPEPKVIAPVRMWAMGQDDGGRLRARAQHSGQGRHRGSPYSIDDNPWGRSSGKHGQATQALVLLERRLAERGQPRYRARQIWEWPARPADQRAAHDEDQVEHGAERHPLAE